MKVEKQFKKLDRDERYKLVSIIQRAHEENRPLFWLSITH